LRSSSTSKIFKPAPTLPKNVQASRPLHPVHPKM
jgi:hypothetical protein